jgi:hypothetical protein
MKDMSKVVQAAQNWLKTYWPLPMLFLVIVGGDVYMANGQAVKSAVRILEIFAVVTIISRYNGVNYLRVAFGITLMALAHALFWWNAEPPTTLGGIVILPVTWLLTLIIVRICPPLAAKPSPIDDSKLVEN